jgi:hypothetical protein
LKKLRRSSEILSPASKDDAKSSLALVMAAVEEARSQAHLVNDCAADAKFAYMPHDVYADLAGESNPEVSEVEAAHELERVAIDNDADDQLLALAIAAWKIPGSVDNTSTKMYLANSPPSAAPPEHGRSPVDDGTPPSQMTYAAAVQPSLRA